MSVTELYRIVARVAFVALIAPALLSSVPSRAQPAKEAEIGAGIICDTRKQIESFVTHIDSGLDEAVQFVNTEEKNPNACGFAMMAYVRGSEIATVRTKESTFRVVEIFVIGIRTTGGFQAVTPTSFYSLLKVDEVAV